jgi:hypothetical protein
VGFWHALYLYSVIKALRPKHIVESGAHRGIGTWYLRQAAGPDAEIIVVSPERPAVYVDTVKSRYFVADKFQDFNKIDWDSLNLDMERTLVFFDDHQSGLRRTVESQERGFIHLVFDDNYPPGFGDNYSLKMACDAGRWHHMNCRNEATKTKCEHPEIVWLDKFNDVQRTLTWQDTIEHAVTFASVVDVYYEFPPLWNIKGRQRFHPTDAAVDASSRPAVFTTSEEAEITALGLDLRDQASRFTYFPYVRVKQRV